MKDVPFEPPAAAPFVRKGLTTIALHFSIDEIQSRMQLREPDALDLRYTRTMMGFLLFEPAPKAIAMLGLGGGSLAKFCFRHLPSAVIDVVEIDPRVIALRDTFRVPPDDDRFKVVEADGADFVGRAERRYDVVLLDAFGPGGLPRRLSAPRFYDDCRDLLAPRGLVVANFHTAAPDFDACVGRLERTFEGNCLRVDDREAGNSIVFARKQANLDRPDAGSPVARPRHLDPRAWKQLAGAFERIATAQALRRRTPAS